jgi:endonuclease YncB( thermonuclease family)
MVHQLLGKRVALAAGGLALASLCAAEDGTVTYGAAGYKTTAPSSEYKVRYPFDNDGVLDFRYHGNSYRMERPVVPARTPLPRPVVLGRVKPYSDAQYGDLVLQTLKQDNLLTEAPAARQEPVAAATPAPTSAPADPKAPELTAVTVVKVKDRGVLETADGQQIRLRGVSIPSVTSKHAPRREWATTATAVLEHLLLGKTVYIVVEPPVKGLDGSTLAVVHFRDGTEVNQLALENGLGIIAPGEFLNEEMADQLIAAEKDARADKRGIWRFW